MSDLRLFDVPAETVVESVGCTWCGAELGERCRLRDLPNPSAPAHAQRWRDYWNATHSKAEQTPVFPAHWLARA